MDRRREFTDERVLGFVRRYHAYVREDPAVGPVFCGCVNDWDAHSARLAAYWARALRHEPTPEFPQLTAVRFGMDGPTIEHWLEPWNRAADEIFAGKVAEEVKLQGQIIAQDHMGGNGTDG